MKFTRTLSAAALLLAACAAGAEAPPAPAAAAPVLLRCGHVLDPARGGTLDARTLVIANGRIRSIEAAGYAMPGAREVDLARSTCLPGLIDAHVHLTMQFGPTTYSDRFRLNPADYAIRGTVYARRTLLAGFTTVRNLGDDGNESLALRDAIDAGLIPGPRIVSAGQPIGSTGGHADPTDGFRMDLAGDPGPLHGIIDSPADAWKAVREHYKLGVDVIKIMPSGGVLDESASGDNPQMTLEEIRAAVAAARDYGYRVAAHAHGAEAIRRAVLGGVDSIEHGTYMDAADMALMKQHGTWYVPTITAGEFVAEKAKVPGYYPPQVAAKAAAIGPKIMDTAGRAWRAGVRIAFGTDAGVFPHGENAREFVYLTQAGMPALEALRTATVNAAALLGRGHELGRLAPGYRADVIAVDGDPLADIRRMQRVSFVMKDGTVYREDGRAIMAR
jgi:imidazolonepropionase-like amidohydrolase